MSATPGTPAQSSEGINKRALTSPFDPNDVKKARAQSETSETSDMGEPDNSSYPRLCDDDIKRITLNMTAALKMELPTMISDVVDNVVKKLNSRFDELDLKNKSLENKVAELEERLLVAETKQDRSDQYSRRNFLRISGIPEQMGESTDQIVLDVAEAVGAQLSIDEIDRSHRSRPIKPTTNGGNPNPRPRDIIVKFISYRARSKLQSNKRKLRDSKFKGVFVNEDLTRVRSLLFQKARKLVKDKRVASAWTADGVIIIKDNLDHRHRVETQHDLDNVLSKLTR